jgi:hypothetical protein
MDVTLFKRLSSVSASASPAWIPYSVWQHLFASNFICSKCTCDNSCHRNRDTKTLCLPSWQCSHTVSFLNVLNNPFVSILHHFPIKPLFVGQFIRWLWEIIQFFVTFCLILASSSGWVRSMASLSYWFILSIFLQIYHIYPNSVHVYTA